MKVPVTTTLDHSLVHFVQSEAKKQKVNRNDIYEKALRTYRRLLLAKEVKEGLLDRQGEYQGITGEFAQVQNIVLHDL